MQAPGHQFVQDLFQSRGRQMDSTGGEAEFKDSEKNGLWFDFWYFFKAIEVSSGWKFNLKLNRDKVWWSMASPRKPALYEIFRCRKSNAAPHLQCTVPSISMELPNNSCFSFVNFANEHTVPSRQIWIMNGDAKKTENPKVMSFKECQSQVLDGGGLRNRKVML